MVALPSPGVRTDCIAPPAKEQVLHCDSVRGQCDFPAAKACGRIRGRRCLARIVLLERPNQWPIGALKGDDTMTEDREIKNYEKLAERAEP